MKMKHEQHIPAHFLVFPPVLTHHPREGCAGEMMESPSFVVLTYLFSQLISFSACMACVRSHHNHHHHRQGKSVFTAVFRSSVLTFELLNFDGKAWIDDWQEKLTEWRGKRKEREGWSVVRDEGGQWEQGTEAKAKAYERRAREKKALKALKKFEQFGVNFLLLFLLYKVQSDEMEIVCEHLRGMLADVSVIGG